MNMKIEIRLNKNNEKEMYIYSTNNEEKVKKLQKKTPSSDEKMKSTETKEDPENNPSTMPRGENKEVNSTNLPGINLMDFINQKNEEKVENSQEKTPSSNEIMESTKTKEDPENNPSTKMPWGENEQVKFTNLTEVINLMDLINQNNKEKVENSQKQTPSTDETMKSTETKEDPENNPSKMPFGENEKIKFTNLSDVINIINQKYESDNDMKSCCIHFANSQGSIVFKSKHKNHDPFEDNFYDTKMSMGCYDGLNDDSLESDSD